MDATLDDAHFFTLKLLTGVDRDLFLFLGLFDDGGANDGLFLHMGVDP